MRVSFIINGSRKLSVFAEQVIALVEDSTELEGYCFYTKWPLHAIDIARRESSNLGVIVAVGGDGTCNEVINGIDMNPLAKANFAVIPTGSGNDFSRQLKVKTPQEFVAKILSKSFQFIDIGMVEMCEKESAFLNVADIGFGAKVVELLNRQRKRGLRGKASYAIAILRAFFLYQKSYIEIQGDEFEFKGKFLMVAFCNGTTFGHGLVVNPYAEIDSSQLNLTVIGDVSIFTYLRNLNRLKRGIPIKHPKVHYYETSKANLKISGTMQWIEGDGELLGSNVKTVYVKPKRIQLLV